MAREQHRKQLTEAQFLGLVLIKGGGYRYNDKTGGARYYLHKPGKTPLIWPNTMLVLMGKTGGPELVQHSPTFHPNLELTEKGEEMLASERRARPLFRANLPA